MRSEVPFPDVIDFQEGPGIMARDFREAGVPLLRLAGLSGGSLLSGCNHLDPLMVEHRWAHFRLRAGDTLISTSASLGRVGRVNAQAMGAIPYTGIIRMRPRDGRLLPEFIQYVVAGEHFQRQVEAMGAGSVMRHFGPTHLRSMTVLVPPPGEQRTIVQVLGALDNKLASNRWLAGLLEETAATLFRARFVDFVGVVAFEESEIGRIPRGWTLGALADLVSVTMGQSPPGSSYSEDRESGLLLVQGMGGFGDRYPNANVYTSAPSKRASAGDTLMTVRAPVGAVNVARTDVCLGRGVAGIRSEHPAFTESLVRSLASRWASEESGTIFPAVNRKQILGLRLVVPRSDAIAGFERMASSVTANLTVLHDETESLVAVRDALLPKLISGQVWVPDTADPAEVIEPGAEALAASS